MDPRLGQGSSYYFFLNPYYDQKCQPVGQEYKDHGHFQVNRSANTVMTATSLSLLVFLLSVWQVGEAGVEKKRVSFLTFFCSAIVVRREGLHCNVGSGGETTQS